MTELTTLLVSSAPLLRAIAKGGDQSGTALAEASGRKRNNISRDLGGLEKAGLITREPGSPIALTDEATAGLAILDGKGEPAPAAPGGPGFAEVPLELIDRDPTLNPRTIFDDEELESLAASIRDKGVAQPILLRQGLEPGRFRIVAGERRFRASQKARRPTIPAMIRELTDDQALEIATIENIQRVNLSPLEEAKAFKAIIEARMRADPELALKDAKAIIADAVRKTVRYVEQRMDLLVLPAILQVRLEADPDTEAHLTLKDARFEVQRIRRIESARKAKILPPDQLLAMAEIWDATQARGEALESYSSTRYVAVGHRGLEDGEPLAALIARRFVGLKSRHRGDPRHFVCGLDYGFSMKDLEEQAPGFAKARARTLHDLRALVVGAAQAAALAAKGEYATWPLNPEFADQADPTLIEAAEAWVEQDRQRTAEDFDRQAQWRAAKAAADAKREREAAQLERDKGDYGRNLLAAVREFERVGGGLDREAFTAAFAGLLATFDIPGPYAAHLTEDAKSVELRDGQGVDTACGAFTFEARRRLFAVAMNYAAGLPLSSGEDLVTPWSAPEDVRSAEGTTRAEFVDLTAGMLLEDYEPLATLYETEEEEARDRAEAMAVAGLEAFLKSQTIEFADPEYDWSDDGAMQLAELIRLEGLGQGDDFEKAEAMPADDDDGDDGLPEDKEDETLDLFADTVPAAEAMPGPGPEEDAEIPAALRNLAGPGAQGVTLQ